jgi:hypothetical protein
VMVFGLWFLVLVFGLWLSSDDVTDRSAPPRDSGGSPIQI